MSEPLVDPDGFGRLAGSFLATRENRNTRAGYARDLAALADALGVPPPPPDAPGFGVEDDAGARAAAVQLSALPLDWWQRWRDGFGLPPHSYESYVAPGLGWITLLGSASLLVFLAYEAHRWFAEKRWWHFVQEAGDLAMLVILYHGYKLCIQFDDRWVAGLWTFYGVILVAILIRSYYRKYTAWAHGE